MAEIKNSFLRSKMNKDLDDRLIPNGEYRDAQNISVGKSEDDDIGALETILGNTEKQFTITPALPSDIQTIGYLTDEYTQTIFVFATNYTDVTPETTPVYAPSNKRCIIYSWSPSNPANANVIADGNFLNFSTTNPVQASLIENLLFFTDNRNQPRKVNINQSSGYYTDEAQISVAKYNPYTPISLLKKTTGVVKASPAPTTTSISINAITTGVTNAAITASKEVVLTTTNSFITKDMFIGGVGIVGHCKITQVRIQGSNTIINFTTNQTIGSGITLSFYPPVLIGMSVISTSSGSTTMIIEPAAFITVSAINNDVITLSSAVTLPTVGDIFTFLISTMTNKSSEPNWPGDPDYLESRYVRFSYRYRFNDGEYSIFAPFSQIAYIPKQKGYFKSDDEDNAFRSTIVAWMENNVNNIELLITLPDNSSNLSTSYKIQSLDILYKESDQTAVKVLETIPVTDLVIDSVKNIYTYEYQSRKPYKTLPTDQTIRVYDKVPVRALAQETAGNRIMYGNFRNTYSAPDVIEYDVKIIDKGSINTSDSWIEYPNHSLKQNRNYQVGFILADKYGRQSPVILSPVNEAATNNFLGSTIFNSYNASLSNMKSWFGDTLQLSITEGISSGTNSLPNFTTGQPGLYAAPTNINGFAIKQTPVATILDTQYEFTLDSVTYTSNINVPVEGDYLRGEYIDYVKVNGPVTNDGQTPARYTVPTNGRVNSSYLNNTRLNGVSPDLNFAYTINPIGWYSYKVVVKQTEQDYYNCYLPGFLNGYPEFQSGSNPFPPGEDNKTAHTVLINDNINKIPRDLSEVGPQQKQFRSSVQLFGRVENTLIVSSPPTADDPKNNRQFFPGVNTDTAITIGTATDLNMSYSDLKEPQGHNNFYQLDTDPLIARISTSQPIGVTHTNNDNTNMYYNLSIYETEPQDSLLDIFWETGTVGLISDLNADVLTGYDGPSNFTATNFQLLESDASGHPITAWFYPISSEGTQFDAGNPTTATGQYSIIRDNETGSMLYGGSGKFWLEQDNNPLNTNTYLAYRIVTNSDFLFIDNSNTLDVYEFNITVTVDQSSVLAPGDSKTITINGSLENATPSFVNNPLPSIIATVDQEILPNQDTSAENGTADITQKTQQLKWSILSGNPTGLNGQPSFDINPTSGQLTQTENNTPNGQHIIVLKIEDANGNVANGSLFVTANQSIFIGPEPANDEIDSACTTGPIDTNTGLPNNNTSLITNGVTPTAITGVWYLAANALSGGYTSGTVNDDIPITPSAANSITQTLFRLGSGALTKGQVVFSLNASLEWFGTTPPNYCEGETTWKVWHRSSSSSAWAHVSDINNQAINSSGTYVKVTTANTGTADVFYNQLVLAFSQPGEYTIAAVNSKSLTTNSQPQALACWVNSNDLNYSTCVIEDGTNITGGTARASYEYGISTSPGSGYNCSYGTSPAWSNVPYGQYVPQFFNSSTLSTPYAFADAGNGISGYLAFKTQGSSPFDDPSSYRYSFSTRFTTADGKVYKPNPWTQCYIENCGNTAAATSTCTVLQMEYPY